MNTRKQGREPIYDSSLKIAVAREYLTGNLGYGLLARKYDLGIGTVQHFIKWYKKHYPDGLQQQLHPGSKSVADNQLSRQLKEAHLKIAGLEMLIEIARKELGIDIVKKPGTKQSLK